MPYGPDREYPWGDTFVLSLNPDESFIMPAVAEDGVVFLRRMTFSVGGVQTTGACLVNSLHVTGGEHYLWRVTETDPPFITQNIDFAMVKGTTARVTCNAGMLLVSWRERYELVQ